MTENQPHATSSFNETDAATRRRRKHVPEACATAQRAKLDTQAETRAQQDREAALPPQSKKLKGKQDQRKLLAHRRANTTITSTIEDYLQDHAGATTAPKRWNGTRQRWVCYAPICKRNGASHPGRRSGRT